MSQITEPTTEQATAHNLKDVIDALPESVYKNPTWRGMAYFYRDAALYLGLLAALVFVSNIFLVLLLELVMGLVVAGLFIVGHDSAHGALFSSKRRNRVVGKLAFLPSMHVFEGWVLGHNRVHHPYTVRQGYDFVWHPVTPQEFQKMNFFGRLLHRLEWSWAGAGIYYMHQIWLKKMMVGPFPARWVSAIRRDRLLIFGFFFGVVALFSGIGVLMGDSVLGIVWLDVRTIVLPFVFFSYLIGGAVHVHHIQPEIRWWNKGEWTKFRAQMEGTTVLRAPKWVNFFLHWIMVHVPHHVDMRIPMYHLEEATDAIEEAFPGTIIDRKLRLRDYLRGTHLCKLYDFDEGRWMTYGQGRKWLRSLTPSGKEFAQQV